MVLTAMWPEIMLRYILCLQGINACLLYFFLFNFYIVKLEDAEFAKHMALKAKTQIENDMEELHNQIEAITRMKDTVSVKLKAY